MLPALKMPCDDNFPRQDSRSRCPSATRIKNKIAEGFQALVVEACEAFRLRVIEK